MKHLGKLIFSGACLLTLASVGMAQTPTVIISDVELSQYIWSPGYNKCLYTTIDGSEGSEPPGKLYTCAKLNEQRWYLDGDRAKGYQIHPLSNKNLCLDIDGGTISDAQTRVVLYTCQSTNKYQRWSVAPITTTNVTGRWAIFNVGLMGTGRNGKYIPKALTAGGGTDGTELVVMEFHSGDFQNGPAKQLWRSQEIWCYHTKRKHAVGTKTISYSAGGHTSQTSTPNCE
jgi:hypothetical protein